VALINFPNDAVETELFGEPGRLAMLNQAARIIIIDDEEANVLLITQIMQRAGYQTIIGLTSAAGLAELVKTSPPDLVITDCHMPDFDGFAVLKILSEQIVRDRLPVLMITGDEAVGTRQRALTLGARDFVTKPFDTVEVLLRVHNLLETRMLFQDLRKQNRTLLESAKGSSRELESTRIEMAERLAIAAEYRDDQTSQHNQRVGELASQIAQAIGLTPEDAGLMRRAAALHDIGKIGIPDALLFKPDRLTPGEVRVMRTHSAIGARILGGSHVPLLKLAESIALSHHERWDGSGYPGGLKGDGIPLPGRIVAVADTFDAITSDRPYRPARSVREAVAELKRERDVLFEGRLVDVLERIIAARPPSQSAAPHLFLAKQTPR
jgi:putative two-component system response regulator